MDTVTTWIGVAGSTVSAAVTVATLYIRAKTKREIAAIEAGTPEAARIVAAAVTSFQIDPAGLTRDQKYSLARREIAGRDRRHARTLWISLAFAVVAATATVVLASRGTSPHLGEGGSPAATSGSTGDSYDNGSVHVNTNPGTINVNR